MSTRRPRVPRQHPAAEPHRHDDAAAPDQGSGLSGHHGGSRGGSGAGSSFDSKNGSQAPGGRVAAGKAAGAAPAGRGSGKASPASAKNAGRPSAVSPAGPDARSKARAEARAELEGAIRTGSPSASGSGGGAAGGAASDQAGGPSDGEFRPVPAKAFSGRLLALGLVMLVITVLLAPSVHTWAQQRSDIAALEAEIAAARAEEEGLERQLDRWEDPAYVRQQARDRIFLVMPGDRTYLVKGEDGVEVAESEAAVEDDTDLEWVDALWDSVRRSATTP